VFEVAATVAAFAFLLSWALEQRPLRETVPASTGIGESFAMPRDTASLAEAARTLTVLVGRERRREMVERLAQRAGVDLSAAASWLIVRLHEDPSADIPALCRSFDIPVEAGERALQELADRSLVTVSPVIAGDPRGRGDRRPAARGAPRQPGVAVRGLVARPEPRPGAPGLQAGHGAPAPALRGGGGARLTP
jgi:hypothetical protein